MWAWKQSVSETRAGKNREFRGREDVTVEASWNQVACNGATNYDIQTKFCSHLD